MLPAKKLLIILIVLTGSLCGCAGRVTPPTPPVADADCGNTARPVLSQVDGSKSFDSPGNVAALMTIIDQLKDYAGTKEDEGHCLRAQVAARTRNSKE